MRKSFCAKDYHIYSYAQRASSPLL
ncbi:hypothetical protein V1478_012660 [Vespula squamosa]|uniref:Uncharacterized protein n=1 Tax=Vespula squamosa TaxID=30214 RepID=A0ABD2AB86_VESSQ